MPNVLQVRKFELTAARQYRYYREIPFLTEQPPFGQAQAQHSVVWCGSWRAHASSVSHVQWISENSTLMTAGTDGLVRLWDEEVSCAGCFILFDIFTASTFICAVFCLPLNRRFAVLAIR